jgi:hypothetical protein
MADKAVFLETTPTNSAAGRLPRAVAAARSAKSVKLGIRPVTHQHDSCRTYGQV